MKRTPTLNFLTSSPLRYFAAIVLCCTLGWTSALAQACSIGYSPAGSVIILSLDANGQTIINEAVISPYLVSTNCPTDPSNVALFTDASGNNPYNTGINYDCSDLTTSVTLYAQVGGNSGLLQFAVVIVDAVPPSLTCPANATATLSGNSCSVVVSGITVAVDENCEANGLTTFYTINGGAQLGTSTDYLNPADPSGETFPVGTNTVVYTAEDAAGNTNSCSFTVTVSNNNAPAAIPAQTVSVDAGTCSFTFDQAFVDGIDPTTGLNCYGNFQLTNPTLGSTRGPGTYTVSFSYDANPGAPASSTTTGTFQLTVNDGEAPQATFSMQSVTATACTATYNFNANGSISDNCTSNLALSVAYVIQDASNATIASGTGYGISETLMVGTYTVTYQVTDASNNTTAESYQLLVIENTAPVAVCQAATVNLDNGAMGTVNVMDFENGSTDNCSVTSMEFALDLNGDGNADTDINGNIIWYQSYTFNNCTQIGTYDVFYRVFDQSNNVSPVCMTTVTVQDQVLPVAQCQAITRTITGGAAVTVSASEVDNMSFDNCNPIINREISVDTDGDGTPDTPFASGYSFACAPGGLGTGTFAVDLRVTDGSGQSTVCPTTVTIVDGTDPVAMAMDYSANFNASGNVTVTATDFDNGSTDECSGVTLTYALGIGSIPAGSGFENGNTQPTTGYVASMNFACMDAGMYYVFVQATDGSMNTDITGPVTLTLSDNTNPTASCVATPYDYTYDFMGNTTIQASDLDNGSADNCGITSIQVYNPAAGVATAADSITFDCGSAPASLTLRVTDAAGNVDECTVALNQVDNTPPTALCINGTSIGLNTNQAFLTVAQVDNSSFDVCGGSIVSREIARMDDLQFGQSVTFDCADAGTTVMVTLRVTDAAGLQASCNVAVAVQETQQPMFTFVPAAVTIECSAYSATQEFGGMATATDNCVGVTITFSDSALGGNACNGAGIITRTYTATDDNGNSITATQTINLQDTSAPTFSAPADLTLDCPDDFNDLSVIGDVTDEADACDTFVGNAITQTNANGVSYAAYRGFGVSSTLNGTSYDFGSGNTTAPTSGFTSVNSGIGVNFNNAPASVRLQGSTNSLVRLTYGIPASGFLIFTPSTTNTGAAADNNFGYRINGGAFVDLDEDGQASGMRRIVAVNAGDTFTFEQQNNGSGRGITTLNNFSFAASGQGPAPLDCPDNYDIVRLFDLSDNCGNAAATQAQYITVRDDDAPVVNYTLGGTIATDNDQCGAQIDLDLSVAGRVIEGCEQNYSISYTTVPNINVGNGTDNASGFYPPGNYTVTFTVADNCNPATTQTYTFTVEDQQAPEPQCVSIFNVTLDNNNMASVTVADLDNGSSDACGIDYVASSVSPSSFDQSNIGQAIPVTLTIVDVNGNSNTCTSIVEVNGIATFNGGAVTGPTGSVVQVPVTVDNLRDVAGLQLSLALADSSIAKITGISNINPALSGGNTQIATTLNGGAATFTYVNGGNGSTAPSFTNGTQLFTLTVAIEPSPTATAGDMTDVVLYNDQVSFYPSGATVPTVGASATNDGSVTVGAPGAQQTISGSIVAASTGNAVENVDVQLSGTMSTSQQTGAAGTYSFTVPTGADATITPTKNTNWNGSGNVDVSDVLAIQTNIPTPGNLSNWQQVAADVNGDGTISIQDAVLAIQIAFGQELTSVTTSWKFSPMPLDADPLANGFDQQLSFTNVQQSITGANFVGIKTADVVSSFTDGANLTGSGDIEARNAQQLEFVYDDYTLANDETYTVQLRSRDFTDVRGFQHTIAFDETLVELVSIAPAESLPNFSLAGSFDQSAIADGLVSVLWVEPDGVALEEDTEVLSLTFRALHGNVNISDVLVANDERIKDLAVFANGDKKGVKYTGLNTTNAPSAPVAGLSLRDARPNPFTESTIIGFALDRATRAQLIVSDVNGRVVFRTEAEYAPGYHEVQLDNQQLEAAGVYHYQLRTDLGSVVRKMVKL